MPLQWMLFLWYMGGGFIPKSKTLIGVVHSIVGNALSVVIMLDVIQLVQTTAQTAEQRWTEGKTMAENYKELYHWAKYMLDKYQDEIVPGLREQLEKRVEVVRCKDCKHLMFSDFYGECGQAHMGVVKPDDFCSYGDRKEDGI